MKWMKWAFTQETHMHTHTPSTVIRKHISDGITSPSGNLLLDYVLLLCRTSVFIPTSTFSVVVVLGTKHASHKFQHDSPKCWTNLKVNTTFIAILLENCCFSSVPKCLRFNFFTYPSICWHINLFDFTEDIYTLLVYIHKIRSIFKKLKHLRALVEESKVKVMMNDRFE